VDVYSTETGEIIEVTAPITSVFQTVTDMNELKMADVEGICSHEQEFEGIRGELETRRVTGPIVSVEYFDATP